MALILYSYVMLVIINLFNYIYCNVFILFLSGILAWCYRSDNGYFFSS